MEYRQLCIRGRKRKLSAEALLVNTSSNRIIRELVEEADEETRSELEVLMNGGFIEKPVREEITYGDIHESRDNLWNFLFFTGYLKVKKPKTGRREHLFADVHSQQGNQVYLPSVHSDLV